MRDYLRKATRCVKGALAVSKLYGELDTASSLYIMERNAMQTPTVPIVQWPAVPSMTSQ